ncbi:pyruvate ferredoxin oxidoreductase subunit alpha [Oscillospiraceae bacterium]|nr:pyruvate ferredoxin oxidoreductase subunit alpha [Oscillospiraceae bacterium]BDF76078.1 pyruvate ferredoxin oxidoreductase subunit alpha [Oscillospiraceae bacterium]
MAHYKMLDGNAAAMEAIKMAKVKVISAYPITPQSPIAEKLADMVQCGEIDAKYVRVESEHTALSVALGAQLTGVRTATATASVGLALMHEIVNVVSGLRMPIVMPVVNRALAAPWSLWCDHQDSMEERDSGWLQLYCENVQDVFDLVSCAYRVAEHEKVLLPCMVCLDGFFLSHSMQKVSVPETSEMDSFIGPYVRRNLYVDPVDPMLVGNLTPSDEFGEMRYQQERGFAEAEGVMDEVFREFQSRFGRCHERAEGYCLEDADTVLVTLGSMSGTAKCVVNELRQSGQKVGLLKIVSFRPFPYELVRRYLEDKKQVLVLDRSAGLGARFAPLCTEISAALYGSGLPVRGYVAGLGGRDISLQTIRDVFADGGAHPEGADSSIWIDVKENAMELRQVLKAQ